ncbi:MAG: hypothetical protein JKX70_02125 [Phycisphaerales bacterium]|nr:hypothetical protein [Phycisphaerales bacterium]
MQLLCTPYSTSPGGMQPILWGVVSKTLYKLIPSPAYRTRRAVLGLFGAKLDPTSRIRGGVAISAPWNLTMDRKSSIGEGAIVWAHAPIVIGKRTVISQYCFVSSARWVDDDPRNQEEPAELTIGDDVWIAAESVVLGGQSIPNGVLVGARSSVFEPLDAWMIATGHPAKSRRERPYNGPRA